MPDVYHYTNPLDPARADDGLFGPGSVTWRIMSAPVTWMTVLRSVFLQALVGVDRAAAPASMAALDAYIEQMRPRLYACDEAKQALRLSFRPPVPDGIRALRVGVPVASAFAFASLPRWARDMYGHSGGPLGDVAATAGLRATRVLIGQERLFLGAMRALHRAERAGKTT
jgi:uncharacterized protein (DUF2236 family)